MEDTYLVGVQHTVAGRLSGGQKRRLMLGLELLGHRDLLFLDEPTSGVDATAALELVTILRRISMKVS
ncbi:MAG: ATP-binding cassette domain-containing protein [Parasphingorhabdus sp.]